MKRLDLPDGLYETVIQYLSDMVEMNDSVHEHIPAEPEELKGREQNELVRDLISKCRGDNGHEAGAITVTIWQKDNEDVELIANVVPYDYYDGTVCYVGRLEVDSNDQRPHPMEGRTVNLYLPILELLGMPKD